MGKATEYTRVAVDKLIPYVNNAKQHSDSHVTKIASSIREFGFLNPVLIDSKHNVIAGHGRILAAKKLGLSEVPCLFVEGLTDAQRKAYTLADNRLSELGEWDMELVMGELAELDELGFDTELTGFEFEIEPEIIDDEDDVPEPPTEPKAKLGDLYKLGRHRLICGDSTDVNVIDRLMDGVKADMVFTDPPYGMNLNTDWSGAKSKLKFYIEKGCKGQGSTYDKVVGDNEDFDPSLVTSIFANFGYCKEIFIWGADYYPELLNDYKEGNLFVWDKRSNDDTEIEYVEQTDKMYGSQFELVWSKAKHRKQIARVKWAGIFGTETEFDRQRVHPTQKPTKLACWFLSRYSEEGQVVADIYGGSGSTLIACEQLNRKCYMCELDPKYIDVIIERWENLTGEKAVLISE